MSNVPGCVVALNYQRRATSFQLPLFAPRGVGVVMAGNEMGITDCRCRLGRDLEKGLVECSDFHWDAQMHTPLDDESGIFTLRSISIHSSNPERGTSPARLVRCPFP